MFSSLLAIPILLAVITPGTAQRINASTTTPNRVAELRRAEVTTKISALRRERIRTFWGRMVTRIEAMITRLGRLIDRMERRIAVIEASDEELDITQAKADVTEAKNLLATAEASLQAAQDDIQTVIDNPDPKAAFGDVIDTIQGIKEDLIAVHKLLVQAIGEIKGLRVGTPTPTVTP
jgi:hypothetical protein